MPIEQFSVNWRTPDTDNTLRRARPGEILRLSLWTGSVAVDSWHYIRVTSAPTVRTTWHPNVDQSMFRRPEWLDFQLVFGELVFDHNTRLTGEPVWEVYPQGCASQPALPVAIAYRFEAHRIPVASLWWGEPGQGPDEFRREVLAALPQPLSIEERFAILGNIPVTVLVAAETSPQREQLVRHLKSQHNLGVQTAGTEEAVIAARTLVNVVIVADELPPRAGEKPDYTYCIGFIRNQLIPYQVPLVGWAVSAERRLQITHRTSDLENAMMHLAADCGRVLNGKPEPGRDPVNHILDALGVPATKE